MINHRRLWHGTIIKASDVVESLHEWYLLPYKGNALEALRKSMAAEGDAKRFRVRVQASDRAATPPIDAVFELLVQPTNHKPSFAFAWSQHEGFPLPSLFGTVTVKRLGPFAAIAMHAEYARPGGTAGRALDEAIGGRLARETLREALRAVCYVLKQRVK